MTSIGASLLVVAGQIAAVVGIVAPLVLGVVGIGWRWPAKAMLAWSGLSLLVLLTNVEQCQEGSSECSGDSSVVVGLIIMWLIGLAVLAAVWRARRQQST